MSVTRNPVVLFLATGLLALVVIVVGTSTLSGRAASDEAVAGARATTNLLAHSVAEPSLPKGLVDGEPGAIDRFDREVLQHLMVTDVKRVKVWDEDGMIVYSDKTQLIGDVFPLGEEELDILRDGGTEAEVSDLSEPENRYERDSNGLLEVYTQIWSPEGQPLLFEVYYSDATIDQRRNEIFGAFRPITLAALGLVVLVATALLWLLTRRLRRGAEERERLLRAAVDASDAERGRIARDLHDGVVQDLAGAAFAVSALARDESVPDRARVDLADAGDSMRTSLRALRSLMVEIYPPDLTASTLSAAMQDLLAPAEARGIAVSAHVDDVGDAPAASVRLVWRVAQEAVRNALRHSGAEQLTVSVTDEGRGLRLEVGDDGAGFDPASRPAGSQFGLRGLAGLVAEAGGSLTVTSAPGNGTTVLLTVDDPEHPDDPGDGERR